MVVADRQHKTLPELYSSIGSANEITEWLAFYKLIKHGPEKRKKAIKSAHIRNQFLMHNAIVKARKEKDGK